MLLNHGAGMRERLVLLRHENLGRDHRDRSHRRGAIVA